MAIEDYKFVLIIDSVIILLTGVVHLVLFFYIKQTDLDNISDILEVSPLFDFSVESDCGPKSYLVFHVWEGKMVKKSKKSKIIDETNISKINGNFFCYNHISYYDLLYNGQIIKEEKQWEGNYTKDCGIIDTLNQHLCVKENGRCPLYDVGIGQNEDLSNYINVESNINVCYNNDGYDDPNKKIIGKLILNEGQPCYKLEEKLWRAFSNEEMGEEHLECEYEVFGKVIDERYKYKGDITYVQIFTDNLSSENYDLLKNKLKDYKVSLYSREFLGIDKKCDEKNKIISKSDNKKLKKNQKDERYALIVGSICLLIASIIQLIVLFTEKCCNCYEYVKNFMSLLVLALIVTLMLVITQGVFLGKMIKYNFSDYNCSDDITNEIIKLENENTNKSILYTAVNLGIDAFIIFAHMVFISIVLIIENCCY